MTSSDKVRRITEALSEANLCKINLADLSSLLRNTVDGINALEIFLVWRGIVNTRSQMSTLNNPDEHCGCEYEIE